MSRASARRLSPFRVRLREARKARGLKQRELADAAGIKAGMSICQYEGGQAEPSLMTLASLCKALDVTADWLVGLSEEGGPE